MPVPAIVAIGFLVGLEPATSSPGAAALQVLGVLLAMAGQALRFYTLGLVQEGTSGQGYQLEAKHLNTRGPYARVRNPLYLGNLGIVLGLVLVAHHAGGAVIAIAFFVGQYFFIVRAEESFLRQTYGARYDDYAARVPRWIPRLTPAYLGALTDTFDLRRALQKEHNPFTAWASGMLLLIGWHLYRSRALTTGALALLVAIQAMVLVSFAVIKAYKRGWLAG